MAEAKPTQRLVWVSKAALTIAAFISLGLLVSPLLKPLEFGDTSVKAKAGFLTPGQGFDTEPSGFISTGWDGPTGEFSHGDIYGLKVGKWMYRVDIVTDPIARARRRLPSTVSGLIEALNSQEPWTHNAAALELSQRGLIVQGSAPDCFIVSESIKSGGKVEVVK